MQDPYSLKCVTLTGLPFKVSTLITSNIWNILRHSLGLRNTSALWEAFLNYVASTL